MSQAQRQTFALLQLVAGSGMAVATREEATNEVLSASGDVVAEVERAFASWPIDNGNVDKDRLWVTRVISDQWFQEICEDPADFNVAVLVAIAERIVADLQTRIKDRAKLALLEALEPKTTRLRELVDPDGADFDSFETAARALDRLYELIGWRWQ